MGESKNIIETLLKLKTVGYFLILWGGTFLFRALSDIVYYMYNYGGKNFTESTGETAFWIIGDIFMIGTAIVLWVIGAKILRTKPAT